MSNNNKRNCFFSTCGTSLLNNSIKKFVSDSVKLKDYQELINKNSNSKKSEINSSDLYKLKELKSIIEKNIIKADNKMLCELSAELKGLLLYFKDQKLNQKDLYYFITTDTFQSNLVFQILKFILENKFDCFNIEEINGENFNTATNYNFQKGVSNILDKIHNKHEEINSYHIVYNLVGGFKVLQAFMQMLGMVYAHEIIYVFEFSNELLSIPKLPIKFDLKIFENNFDFFRRLYVLQTLNKKDFKYLKDVDSKAISNFLYINEDEFCFNALGSFLFLQIKDKFYKHDILDTFSDCIKFDNYKKFKDSYYKYVGDNSKIKDVNETIDELFKTLLIKNYKPLTSKKIKTIADKKDFTHEIYAWNDGKTGRIFFSYDNNNFINLFYIDNLH